MLFFLEDIKDEIWYELKTYTGGVGHDCIWVCWTSGSLSICPSYLLNILFRLAYMLLVLHISVVKSTDNPTCLSSDWVTPSEETLP